MCVCVGVSVCVSVWCANVGVEVDSHVRVLYVEIDPLCMCSWICKCDVEYVFVDLQMLYGDWSFMYVAHRTTTA